MRRLIPLALLAAALLVPATASADFGLVPGATTVRAENADGTIATQAGAHPYAFTTHFELKTDEKGITEGGAMRDVLIDLPPGLLGNPQAVPACSRLDFEGFLPKCPIPTQVGVARVIAPGLGELNGPIYNLIAPPGAAAQLGFSVGGFVALFSASLRNEDEYKVRITAANLPTEATWATATIWGTPADPSHDPERQEPGGETKGFPTDAPLLPFMTLPTSCGSPPLTTIQVDSKLAPGLFLGGDEPAPLTDKGGNPVTLSGCEAVPFAPHLLSGPSTAQAGSPSGLGLRLQLPNQGLLNPAEGVVTETEPQKTVLALPAGVVANPAAANGLGVCTPEQFKAASAADPGCPASSKLGTLLASTPLLAEAIEGSIYLAAPHDNPFDSLLALYIVAAVPQRGAVVKLAGEVTPDPVTGQLTTTVEGLPPLPSSSFEVRLREGARAPLITPKLCGDYATTMALYPFSDPGAATVRSAPFAIDQGAGGGPCASSEAALPFAPTLSAGTTAPIAAAYSPLLFKLTRADGEQALSAVQATLPQGLAGKLAGIPYCPEPAIAAAQARSGEGEGALEAAAPSCPAASEIGTAVAGAGTGPTPYYAEGKAYLAGPYKGAPLSMAVITPAIAGPFDLGVVVVRAALRVNEENAQVTVQSDPLPQILHGLPLELRSVAVRMQRPEFILNPTSCEEKQIAATATSTVGALASLSNRFQVGGCGGLGFKPALKIAFKGKTTRGSHPQLTATLTPRPGDANVSFAQVKLPRAAFLDQAHIKTVCTRVQFAAEQCPAASIYGSAEATTPLLGYPLKGDVYLRSSSHPLPDLVVAFKGPDYQPIRFALPGRTDSSHRALRNTFEAAPDVPVTSFRLAMFGGRRGLIVLTSGLCANRAALVRMRAHNGRTLTARPKVRASCKGRKASR